MRFNLRKNFPLLTTKVCEHISVVSKLTLSQNKQHAANCLMFYDLQEKKQDEINI
jgi:thymidylate synthase